MRCWRLWLCRLKWTLHFATSCNVPIFKQYQNSSLEGFTCAISDKKYSLLEILYSVIAASIAVESFIASSIFNIRILHHTCGCYQSENTDEGCKCIVKKSNDERHKTIDLTELDVHEIDSAKNDNNFKDISTISKITKDVHVSPEDTIREMNGIASPAFPLTFLNFEEIFIIFLCFK